MLLLAVQAAGSPCCSGSPLLTSLPYPADLAPSNMTLMKMFGDFQKNQYEEKNLRFGVREHGMGAITNGIALHSPGFIPYCATFFIFTDYMRSSIRMAALSQVRPVALCTRLRDQEQGPAPPSSWVAGSLG